MWNWKIGRALYKIVPFVTIIDKYVQNKTMFVTLQKSQSKLSLLFGYILKIGTMGWFSLFPPNFRGCVLFKSERNKSRLYMYNIQ